MKKIFLTITAIFAAGNLFAQNIDDALRYSSTDITGTARYRGLSGAFGALGGDLSAIGVNPASSAVFARGAASFSLSSDNINNDVSFFGTGRSTSDNNVAINQAGGVFVFETSPDAKWKKFTLGLNYDRTQNFDDNYSAKGVGNQSIANYFLSFAQGVPLDLLELREDESIGDLYQFLGENEGFGAQQALLGFQSFIIDPVDFDDLNNTAYISNIAGNTFDQTYNFASSGYNGKAAFNIGAQYGENLYLGLNLNSHFFDYEQSTVFRERNTNDGSFVRDVQFENFLRTFGSGFSFQLGAIGKLGDDLRVGFSYDSPTWFTISEEGSQRLRTERIVDGDSFIEDVNPRITNIFQDYEIQTPSVFKGSLAYLFGTQGLISFDYGYTDHTTTAFRPKGDAFFSEQNEIIDDLLTASSSFSIGGEYRIEKWSLRGGYRFVESPYADGVTVGDLTGYSLGLGYNFGEIKLDLAYDTSSQDRLQTLYNTGVNTAASVERNINNVVATLTFRL